MEKQMNNSNKPSFIAYHVREVGENSYWDRVGAAFGHRDDKGFDLILDSLPVSGRVVLRAPTEKPANNDKAASPQAHHQSAE
jgi:hypothetical protein